MTYPEFETEAHRQGDALAAEVRTLRDATRPRLSSVEPPEPGVAILAFWGTAGRDPWEAAVFLGRESGFPPPLYWLPLPPDPRSGDPVDSYHLRQGHG